MHATTLRLLAEGPVAHTAYALVKTTWAIAPSGALEPSEAEPLRGDFERGQRSPISSATDFFPRKLSTDVVVRGSAIAADAVPFEQLVVTVRVGGAEKRLAISCDRTVRRRNGGLVVERGERTTSVPVNWRNAYGGLDLRVVPARGGGMLENAVLALDHPGMYPRNPFGKGFAVHPLSGTEWIPLPNVEDPSDLLTVDRLIVGRPDDWWRQPLPWSCDFMHSAMFPRCTYALGADACLPGPEDESMPEVRRGFLRGGYRSRWNDRATPAVLPDFFQQGSHGMVFRDLPEGIPVRIENMHPARPVMAFKTPKAPRIEWEVEGARSLGSTRLHHLVCLPNEERVTFVYASEVGLPRAFIPGVHKHVPIGVRVDDGDRIDYSAPQPVRELIRESVGGALP